MAATEREARLERGLADLDALVRAGLLCLDFQLEMEAEVEMEAEAGAEIEVEVETGAEAEAEAAVDAEAGVGAGAGTGAGAEAGRQVGLLERSNWVTSVVVGPLTLAAVAVLRADSAAAAEIGRRLHAKERREELTTIPNPNSNPNPNPNPKQERSEDLATLFQDLAGALAAPPARLPAPYPLLRPALSRASNVQ